jgi:hypothetical protein
MQASTPGIFKGAHVPKNDKVPVNTFEFRIQKIACCTLTNVTNKFHQQGGQQMNDTFVKFEIDEQKRT